MTPDNPPTEHIILRCQSCDVPYDPSDNFCRRCGASLNDSSLPAEAVRLPAIPNHSYETVAWRPTLPVAVRGAAVLAAGTLAEVVLRGLASRLFQRGARAAARRTGHENNRRRTEIVKAEPGEEPTGQEAQIVSETWFFRRVRVRR